VFEKEILANGYYKAIICGVASKSSFAGFFIFSHCKKGIQKDIGPVEHY
jgi:hypothetical protein